MTQGDLKDQMISYENMLYEAEEVIETCILAISRIDSKKRQAKRKLLRPENDIVRQAEHQINDCIVSIIRQKTKMRNARRMKDNVLIELEWIYHERARQANSTIKTKMKVHEEAA